ncbi:MAG TPA: tetratricopeptide repeat protein [Casimicrobiaceae bacterium]
MTLHNSTEWLARGREHQVRGRAVDAMLCFRRAIRAAPQSVDARFHLGEVLWQLGRLPDAIAIWTEAAKLAPQHKASHQALTEALLGTGDVAAAEQAALRVLTLDKGDVRAQAIAAISRLWQHDDPEAAASLCAAMARDPQFLFTSGIGGSLALLLDREPRRQTSMMIIDTILAVEVDGARIAAMPASLLAAVLERAVRRPDHAASRKWLEALFTRPWALRDHDALRRAALAVSSLLSDEAAGLAERYAACCARIVRTGAPMIWPRRTAGARLRAIVLTGESDIAWEARSLINALPLERFDVTTMQGEAGELSSRSIADVDADVLIDLVGLSASIGVTLAERPARSTVTIASLGTHNRPPLVDYVAYDARELVAMLERMEASIEHRDSAPLDAMNTAALWKDAVAAHRAGDRAGARDLYRRFLQAQPGFAPAHHLLGVALREDGEIENARSQFALAIEAAPYYAAVHVDAIRAAIDVGDVQSAAALAANAAASIDDPPPPLLRALGSACLAVHDGAGAAAWFERALAREAIDGETHYNHGVALQMERRYVDAARAYQRALAFNPELIAADFNLGTIFAEQGNRDGAIAAYSAVLVRDRAHVLAYKNRGEVLFAAGRLEPWLANFRQFEANCLDALPLAVAALEACQYSGDFDGVERYLEGLRKERFKSRDMRELVDSLEQLLYLLLYFDVEPELIQRFSETYDHAARSIYGDPLLRRATRRPGKIRIGYLSADLRNHVMGKMMWQAVRHHDRDRFDIAFYSTSMERDEWTQRFESMGDRFETVAQIGEREAAERIAADDLDLLVDLSTHTKGTRPGILALKPARVQITHVASAGTLGLSCIDFKLTDRFADVDENQRYQSETLLPMAGCVYPYRPVEPGSEMPLQRERFGIPRDAVVIGAFVSGLKLSRRCLALWRQVIERVPRARIAFSPVYAALAPLYVRLMTAAGIDVTRIVFVPQAPTDAENQLRYTLVDFVLDPMPYGGVNGTLEALGMGIPVVTLVGKRHAERTSYSILANLGVMQTVAHSGSEYVAIAARLADDRAFMAEVREAIRAGLAHSALTNMEAHTRNLEAAYVEALRQRASDVVASADRVLTTS